MKKHSAYFEIFDGGDILRVEVIGIADSPSTDLQGKEDLDAKITIKACTFHGQYSAEFMSMDFFTFRQQLVSLIYDLGKTATFKGIEGYLKIDVDIEPDGYINVRIKACDVPGIGGELSFGISLEKSDIENLVQQLDNILELYPVSD